MSLTYEEMAYYVVPLSQNLKRLFPMVDLQEIQQEMYEWFAKNPEAADRYFGHEDEKQGNRLMAASLLNRARKFCHTEKAAKLGYQYRDLAFYDVAQIEDLLGHVYNTDSWTNPPRPEGEQSGTRQDPAFGGNFLASLADIADAVRKLDKRTQAIIRSKYGYGWLQTDIAEMQGLSDATISDVLSKAPAKIQAILGGARPDHVPDERGGRKAMSNGQSQAINGAVYDG